ncbi:HAD family hydrolase [Myceligenerans xiligouense]|uniref:Phosphoglycolate phosphatase-like HAD superfamily hydrolase n=1 Tax=Myceligenerans xiligouense TaxID=253184 RepID=A0A3N4YG74_9MICO|nr:HAD hydrolase-like protein [Myceligenerans xiligouense]RPF19823.1 phosphoglycolate phosphatase-like HAD superfamily hydrolase [Myceligenerans xiligouense]
MTAAALLASSRAVLLDFDGPITPLMPAPANMHAADVGRAALAGYEATVEPIAATSDHLAVIRWTGVHVPKALAAVEAACTAAEVEAAETCEPTPGSDELIRSLHRRGTPVVIVTNNAAEAVDTYLTRWNLTESVLRIVGRPVHRPDLMKPHPHTIEEALRTLRVPPGRAVLVGDSVTDVEVARTAHVPCIGYAKNPRRGKELREAGAEALTDTIAAIVPVDGP